MSRDGRDGTLEVDDGFETMPLSTHGQSHTVEVNAPYYVGGMPTDVANNAAHNLQVCQTNQSINQSIKQSVDQSISLTN